MVLRLAALVLVVVVALLAVPTLRHLREVPPPPPPPIRLTLAAPPGAELGSGDEALDAAISPDERLIAFVATSNGMTALWRRALDSDRAEVMPGTERGQLPAWNQAGDAVAYFADGHLRTYSLTSGAISDLADAASPNGATWLPDGSILFAPQARGVIKKLLNGMTTDATRLRPTDKAHVFPVSTGVDGGFVYTAVGQDGRRTVRLVRDGEEQDLATTSGHGQVVGNSLLHVRDNVLFAQRLERGTGRLQGRGIPISVGVGITSAGRSLFVASPRLLLSADASPRGRELAWFDMTGQRTGKTGESGEYWQVRLSPDDQYAAVTLVAPLLRTLDIALIPTGPGKALESLTLALAADSDPVWAPDGGRVLFRSLQKGRPMLFSKRAHDKSAEDELLLDSDATATDWRGSTVLFHAPDSTSADIWTVDMRSHARSPAVKSGFNDSDGRWSPDGGWLAYVSDESGRPDVYAKAWPAGDRVRVSSSGGMRPRWSRDGRSLFFLRGSAIMRATLQPGAPSRFESAVAIVDVPGVRDFDVAHQRDALLALVPVSATSSAPVSVLVDWQSTLPTVP